MGNSAWYTVLYIDSSNDSIPVITDNTSADKHLAGDTVSGNDSGIGLSSDATKDSSSDLSSDMSSELSSREAPLPLEPSSDMPAVDDDDEVYVRITWWLQ